MTALATAALGVRTVTLSASQEPAASTSPASSARAARPGLEAVSAASWRRASEANEGNLAHLLREPRGVVPHPGRGVPGEQVRLPHPEAQRVQGLSVDLDGRGILRRVAGEDLGRQVPRVDEHVGHDGPDVLGNGPDVVRDRVAAGLPRLRHHVRHVDNRAGEARYRFPDPAAEQGGDRARKQAPRAEDQNVGRTYRLYDPRRRGYTCRLARDRGYLLARLVHHRLPARNGAVGVADDQGQALGRRGEDPAPYPEEAGCLLHALAEPAGHVGERRYDDVADAVVVQVAGCLEAVVEDLGEPAAFSERHQAVPNVARGRHPELLAQPAAGSPVVRNRHDRREVPDP